jgi:hypothetical protein
MNEQDKANLMRLRQAVAELPQEDQAKVNRCVATLTAVVDALGYRGLVALAIVAVEQDVAKL